jgi:very-short-patch-repair endonuclease
MTHKANSRPTPALPGGEGEMPSGTGAAGKVHGVQRANNSPTPALPGGEGEMPNATGAAREGEMPSATGAAGAVHGLHTANVKIYAQLKLYARHMRQNPTPAERLLWRALRGEQTGVYFRRQHVLGNFIVDFVSLEHRLVIEVDGDIHDHQQAEDSLRTQWLNQTSFHVLRFRNDEVLHHLAEVVARIKRAIAARPSIGAL